MRGLLQLFAAYGGSILFVLLEALSIFMIIQFNQPQGKIFDHSWGLFTAYFDQKVSSITEFAGMKKEVLKLRGYTARLKEKQLNALYSNALNRDSIVSDSLQPIYRYIAAGVISNSIASDDNYLRLDRGSRHQVAPHMGVISEEGIVGIVRDVTEHYSRVMSILHSQSRINASIKSNNYFGTLVWDGEDPLRMQLTAIPKHAEVVEGDTVITNGYGQLFPPGIVIGTVEESDVDPGKNFWTINILLREDLAKIRNVYVVKHLMEEEHEALDKSADE